MTRVLISGACGYIGSVLTPLLLESGHKVVALDNLTRGGSSLFGCCAFPGFRFVEGDARHEPTLRELLKDADVVVPLAGVVGIDACRKRPLDASTVNRIAIARLLRLRSKQQRIVYPATNSGYGAGGVVSEDSPLAPQSHYGRTKVDAEAMVLNAENTVSLRLATLFGVSPNMRWDLLVNDFTRQAVLRHWLVVFEGQYRRNFVHVADAARAFKLFVGAGRGQVYDLPKIEHKVYNIALDEANITKSQLADRVAKVVEGCRLVEDGFGADPDKRDAWVSTERLRATGFRCERGLDAGIAEVAKAVELYERH